MQGGNAYWKEITVRIFPQNDGVVFEECLPEYDYDEELGFVELPKIFDKLRSEGADERLLHVSRDRFGGY